MVKGNYAKKNITKEFDPPSDPALQTMVKVKYIKNNNDRISLDFASY